MHKIESSQCQTFHTQQAKQVRIPATPNASYTASKAGSNPRNAKRFIHSKQSRFESPQRQTLHTQQEKQVRIPATPIASYTASKAGSNPRNANNESEIALTPKKTLHAQDRIPATPITNPKSPSLQKRFNIGKQVRIPATSNTSCKAKQKLNESEIALTPKKTFQVKESRIETPQCQNREGALRS
jgi:hypothetical protein